MIEYLYTEGKRAEDSLPLLVRRDGIVTGEIRAVIGGFQYFPKDVKEAGSNVFPSISSLQRALQ